MNSPRVIYEEANERINFQNGPAHFDIEQKRIWYLDLFSDVLHRNADESERRVKINEVGTWNKNTVPKAVFPSMAIVEQFEELYAIFFG